MNAYATERHLGPSLTALREGARKSVELPAAVLEHQAVIDEDQVGAPWPERERDISCEVVVPMAVLEQLGKDVHAGQLVSITASGYTEVTHIARLIPAQACKQPLVSAAAAAALDLDEAACTTAGGRPVALLSPMLAFNLGLPYQMVQLLQRDDLKKWLARKPTVTVTTIGDAWPADAGAAALRKAWTPGTLTSQLAVATHVGLAHCHRPAKAPPFNIVEYQDNLAAALQQMQGGGAAPPPAEEEVDDKDVDDLASQQHKQKENDTMQALQDYMLTPHYVCLGDVIALRVRSTPLLGPMQSAANLGDEHEESVVFLKVVELTAHPDFQSHKGDAPAHAMLWHKPHGTNVYIIAACGAAVPVGAEAYFLDAPEAGACSGPAASDSALPVARLGRSAYAALEAHHEVEAGKLLSGTWQHMAAQMLPFLHPVAKAPAGDGAGAPHGRIAFLLMGPEGSGKAMEVAATAAALGLNVLEVDGRSLASGSPMDDAECVAQLLSIMHQARTVAPCILLLRRLERIFPQQPNAAVVRRFADTLTHCTAQFCRPHLPELQLLPESEQPEEEPEEGPPLADLPWDALSAARGPDGAPFKLPDNTTRQQLALLHKRFPPGVVLVVGTTSKVAEVPVALRRCFTAEYAVPAADEAQRARALRRMLGRTSGLDDDDLVGAAQATAGFLPCDLGAAACDALLDVMLATLEANGGRADLSDSLNGKVGMRHIEGTLDQVRKRTALDIGAPKIPAVKWDDVGGLEHVKKAILETIELPLKYRDLFSSGLKRRSGVLLYGPPGTGKTLIAKAVATECSINFMSVKGPELINMYVGESEKNVRDVFERARKAQPCVLFFDELDSLAPRRGNGMDSSHVSDRIVAQLLAELDGIGGGRNDVFVIGATNRPDLLDNALMRPGRLDVLLYVGVDRTADSKHKVLVALTRKFKLTEDVDLRGLSAQIPTQCTGADLYGLCADAWMQALRRTIAQLVAEGRASADSDEAHNLDDVEVVVAMADFVLAAQNMVPSLTVADLDKYDRLQDQYSPQRERAAPGGQAALQQDGQQHIELVAASGKGPKLPSRRKLVEQ